MANKENLTGRGFDARSAEEAREAGRKGGIASGKTRREKADLRRMAQNILDGTYTDKNGQQFTGEALVLNGIMANLGNPDGRNWAKAMDLLCMLTGATISPEQKDAIRAQTAKLKAETKRLEGEKEQNNGMIEQLIKGLQDDVHTETESPNADVAGGQAETSESP